MRAPTRGLVAALVLVSAGSAAHAEARHSASRHKKPRRAVEAAPAPAADAAASNDASAAAGSDASAAAGGDASRHARSDAPTDTRQVALGTPDVPGDSEDRDARDAGKLTRAAPPAADHGWQVAIGPYLWASSVDANVSLGGTVSTGVDIGFIPLVEHARYGAEILGEVRHGRFAVYGDLMYGAEAVNGQTSVAGIMVTLSGNASSLLIDGAAGYQLIGDDDAVFSLEARAGIRYQRTEVSGQLAIAGLTLQSPDAVDDGSDAIAGARAVLRPARWLAFSGMFDIGVFGSSNRTWSATADANLRVSSHFLVSAGWRTLTMDRAQVSLTMQGPRAAVQLVF